MGCDPAAMWAGYTHIGSHPTLASKLQLLSCTRTDPSPATSRLLQSRAAVAPRRRLRSQVHRQAAVLTLHWQLLGSSNLEQQPPHVDAAVLKRSSVHRRAAVLTRHLGKPQRPRPQAATAPCWGGRAGGAGGFSSVSLTPPLSLSFTLSSDHSSEPRG